MCYCRFVDVRSSQYVFVRACVKGGVGRGRKEVVGWLWVRVCLYVCECVTCESSDITEFFIFITFLSLL